MSEHFSIEGAKFFEHVSRLGLEGMISKRRDAPYRSGRTKDWLKSKCVIKSGIRRRRLHAFNHRSPSRRIAGPRVL